MLFTTYKQGLVVDNIKMAKSHGSWSALGNCNVVLHNTNIAARSPRKRLHQRLPTYRKQLKLQNLQRFFT